MITGKQLQDNTIPWRKMKGGGFNENPWGRTLYVSATHQRATDQANVGTNRDQPLATLARACSQAQDGDLIIMRPGHTENVIAAQGIQVPSGIDGVTIRGVGTGSKMPKVQFATSTGATFEITGGSCRIENVYFTCPSLAAIVKPVFVNASGCQMYGCIFDDGGFPPTDFVMVGSSFFRMEDCQFECATAGGQSGVRLELATYADLRNNRMRGDFLKGCIYNVSNACIDVQIVGNRLENLNAVDCCIDLKATTTGWIADNREKIATDAQTTWHNNCDAMQLDENYGVNDAGETGVLIGTPSA